MYIRDSWYVVAWDYEVSRTMLRRLVLGEPLVLFRTANGRAVALEDRCCHREAPLSLGKLVGDVVQCPYHGLQFDASGACVKIPSQDRIPANAKVKSYPIVERDRWIWVWMGDPSRADPSTIEDFHWLDDPNWRFGGNYLHVRANYTLIVENLLDATHLSFLHKSSLGTDEFTRCEVKVTRDGDRIRVDRWLMDHPPAPFHKQMAEIPDGTNVDRWQIVHYAPPGFLKFDAGSAPAGEGAREAADREARWLTMWSLHAITPETPSTSHYFFGHAYNRKLDQRWLSDLVRSQITDIFIEDQVMIEQQQKNMELAPAADAKHRVRLAHDEAWIAMRKILERLQSKEDAA